ncbi:DNA primase family protein [Pseudoxanthomonas mexicana]
MSTTNVSNNLPTSIAATPSAAPAKTITTATTGANAFKKGKAKFQILEGHAIQWNFAEYMLSPLAGRWAADDMGVYQWKSTHWELVPEKVSRRLSNAFLHQHFPDKASNAMSRDMWLYAADHLASNSPLPKAVPSRSVVPCLNGYIHVDSSGAACFEAADSQFGLTYVVNATVNGRHGADYQPSAVPTNSMFGTFLASALPDDDVRRLVQEQCALSLIQGPHQIAFWWFGTGGNGKGVMTSILQKFHQRCATVWLNKLSDPSRLTDCVNASLILTPEVARGRWDEEEWKALTGGDPLQAKFLYKDPIRFINRAIHIICSNDRPWVTDVSDAVYRRLCFVEWTQSSGSYVRIDNLDEKIMANEANVVLDWLLEGLQRIAQRGGKFMPEAEWPQSIRTLKGMIRRSNDCIGAWSEACQVSGSHDRLTPKAAIYESYAQWCKDDGRQPLADNMFWRKVWNVPKFRPYQPRTERGPTMRFNDKQVNAAYMVIGGLTSSPTASNVVALPVVPTGVYRDTQISGTSDIKF